MNAGELREWKYNFAKLIMGEQPSMIVNGVRLEIFCNSISFSYKNGSGLFHARNGMNGENDYYPLLKLSCRYSENERFNPTCQPDIRSMVAAVQQSWELFTKG